MTMSPAVQRRVLAKTLRIHREAAGLEAVKVSRALGWDANKVYRLERGEFRRLSRSDVEDLLHSYGILCPDERARLAQMAEGVRKRGWWEQYTGIWAGELPDLEAGATTIYTFDALCIPGLLQTPDYASAVFTAGAHLTPPEVRMRVDARMTRQAELLNRERPPELRALVDEAALRKDVGGPRVMLEQLAQLVEMSRWPGISLRIVPDKAGAHASMGGSFTILAFDVTHPITYLETPTGAAITLDDPKDVSKYEGVYARLLESAMPEAESVAHLTARIDGLKGRGVGDGGPDVAQELILGAR